MVLVQKWPFLQHFFLGNIGQEIVFYDILEPKNTFLGYEKTKFKKLKNWHFSKGPKMCNFPTFFYLAIIGQETVFYDILEPKTSFLGYKNEKFKKSKNWHFSKGVNPWFKSKNGHFSNVFFLGNIGKGNVFYDILEPKNTFLASKNTKFNKSKKKTIFPSFFYLVIIGQESVFYDILEPKNCFLFY